MDSNEPLLVALDDTLAGKSGKKIPGTSWRRDPLGPHFHVNFKWSQRFLQASAIMSPIRSEEGPSRAIPIEFIHAPGAKKPCKTATVEERNFYLAEKKKNCLPKIAVETIKKIRQKMDADEPGKNRPLWVSGDGGYTNKEILKNLPENTVYHGRTRKDTKFFFLPEENGSKGRPKWYGLKAPTPEEVLHDVNLPWCTVQVFAAGKIHDLKFKTITPLLWRSAGSDRPLRVVVIPPLHYRLRKNSKFLYRKPAFLICSDPNISAEEVILAYIKRWEIEVNFRDEKQLFGLGNAQVWNKNSISTVPAMVVASYGFLLWAGAKVYGLNGAPDPVHQPLWRKEKKPRASTKDLISQARMEAWLEKGQSTFSDFVNDTRTDSWCGMKPEKWRKALSPAVFHA